MKLHTAWSMVGRTLVLDDTGRQVALPPGPTDFRAEEWEALAPKIAAADDMLEALRELRDAQIGHARAMSFDDKNAACARLEIAESTADAAIAKAEGKKTP